MSFNLETRQMVLEIERDLALRQATRDARLGPTPPRAGLFERCLAWLMRRGRAKRTAPEAAGQAGAPPAWTVETRA
jgi:hypothetical protein